MPAGNPVTGVASYTGKSEICTADAGWLVSAVFWLCLAAAAVLYAAVALAPPFREHARLSRQHHGQQVQLVVLEQEVEQLARISTALSNEPAYAAELARVDFRTAPPDAEMIPVARPLQLNGREHPPAVPAGSDRAAMLRAEAASSSASVSGWSLLVVEPFATDIRVRRGTLAAAAVLVVFAFGFVHEGHAEQAQAAARGLRSAAGGLAARYRRRAG